METDYPRWDLNMDEVLESWQVSDAIRELIANALDERVDHQFPIVRCQAVEECSASWCGENVIDNVRWHSETPGRALFCL